MKPYTVIIDEMAIFTVNARNNTHACYLAMQECHVTVCACIDVQNLNTKRVAHYTQVSITDNTLEYMREDGQFIQYFIQ